MAKFDHRVQLPKIFQDHQLSILPISRNKYIIGYFDTHLKVNYDQKIPTIKVDFPDVIKSIDYTNISSESIALNCAFNAGIIADLLDVDSSDCYYTLSGRMSTGNFDFKIKNIVTNNYYELSVNNSQCEIDAGFETSDTLLIIEAKNLVEDLLIRQLYYPYRLWKAKISKKVIPVFMTYSNNLFSFFVYEFKDDLNYNSIQLVKQVDYQISPEEIFTQDVSELFAQIKVQQEQENIPFPQANLFPRIIELLSLLKETNLTKKEISDYYKFDIRQAQYYSSSAKYLGLIEEVKVQKSKSLTLTNEGLSILSYGYKQKILSLIKKILEHQVFYEVFEISLSGQFPSKNEIAKIMSSNLKLNPSLIERRSGTVKSWIEWIWKQIG